MSSDPSAQTRRNGMTNHPFAKTVITYFPIIKWFVGALCFLFFIWMSLWLKAEVFTKAEGIALKESAFTKEEAKELEADIEENKESIDLIERKFEIFSVEQKYHTQKLDKILEKVEALHD